VRARSPFLPAARARPLPVVGALLLALALLSALAPRPALAATQVFPGDGDLAAGQGGWTEDEACSGSLLPGLVCLPALATTENFVTDPGGEGNPAPAIGFRATFVVGALNLATPVSVWASPEFTYDGAAPTAISFGYDRKTAIGDLLSLPGSTAAAQVVLVRTDAAGETVIRDDRELEGSTVFQRISADVPSAALVPGGTYRLELRTQFRVGALVALLTRAEILYDNVRLTVESPDAPAATTLPATAAGAGALDLFGEVDPNGAPTEYVFEFGPSAALGDQTSPVAVGDGGDPLTVTRRITGTPGEAVFFRVVAASAGGTARGAILQAEFPLQEDRGPAPTVATLPAQGDGPGALRLFGSVNPNGLATQHRFEYGSTAALGLTTPLRDAGDGSAPLTVSERIGGVAGGEVFYRVVAVSAGGVSRGQVLSSRFPGDDGGGGQGNGGGTGAGGLGACTADLSRPSVEPPRVNQPGRVRLSREQLLINQRISQAAVRRVNAIRERLNGDLTAGDVRAGALSAVKLDTSGRFAFNRALPAGGEVSTAFRPLQLRNLGRGNPARVTLSRQQLLINQRISQAAVRRINQVRAELRMGLTGLNVRDGSLARATLSPGVQSGTGS